MDVSGIANAPKIASWMVDMLFGQKDEAKSETPPPTATTPAVAVAVASSAKPSVAAATGQAIANLPAAGGNATSDPAASQPEPMTVSQINAQIASNLKLTSSQISEAIYSGRGVPNGGYSDTLQQHIEMLQDRATWAAQLNADGEPNLSDDYDKDLPAYITSIKKAFDHHAIVFEKMSDIPGVNDTEHEIVYGPPDQAPVAAGWTGGYDHAALQAFASSLPPSQHGGLFSFGGMMVMATWKDENFSESKTTSAP